MFSNPFLRFCLLCLLCLAPEGLKAQTVIDLHTGRISAKTKDDYNVETRERWQIERDSLEYIDCLTRAFNYLHTDSLLQAQDLFERALRLRPDAPGNYVVEHNLGRIAMARGQWREAVNRLDKVLQSQPSMADAREDRAACYLQLAMFDRAIRDYDNLLLQHPHDPHLLLLKAVALTQAAAPYDALDIVDSIIAEHPDNAEAYLLRAEIPLGLKQPGYARRDIKLAAQHGLPDNEVQHFMLRLEAE